MRRFWGLAALLAAAVGAPAGATAPPSALAQANDAFAKVDDYHMTIAVHETAGDQVQDRTYAVSFKKPSLEKVDIVAGAGKGSGIVWLGGDTVRGHRGGLFSGLKMTLDLHNSQVVTLRGDSVDHATIASMLDQFARTKGTVSQAPGPQIDGAGSDALTLDVADPTSDHDVSRVVLYLSEATHLPVRRESFVGTQLVKSEHVTDMKTNVGLTASDFPW